MKQIHKNSLTGDRGIALIHTLVSDMGFVWTPRNLEAGIDGQIELRDDLSGEVKNCIIFVQSKAVDRHFSNETSSTCDYYCSEADIGYWLGSNGPVILVLSRPSTKEAYWVDIKRYFRDPKQRQSRRVRFDKARDRLDLSCRSALIDLAEPEDSGLYFESHPISEILVSNLVQASFGSSTIYTGITSLESEEKFDQGVHFHGDLPPNWTLWEGQVFSFEDLGHPAFSECIEAGSVERYSIKDWSESNDPDTLRLFVQLLNRALRVHVSRHIVAYDFYKEYFYFEASRDLSPRIWQYSTASKLTNRAVFEQYLSKRGRPLYCRHSAMWAGFKKVGASWYLEVRPTYRFTEDGFRRHRDTATLLKKIKLLEFNRSVLGQVYMWADVLSRTEGIFETKDTALQFHGLAEFTINVGIPDAEWLPATQLLEEEGSEGLGGLFG